jgi:hypothetical protein
VRVIGTNRTKNVCMVIEGDILVVHGYLDASFQSEIKKSSLVIFYSK